MFLSVLPSSVLLYLGVLLFIPKLQYKQWILYIRISGMAKNVCILKVNKKIFYYFERVTVINYLLYSWKITSMTLSVLYRGINLITLIIMLLRKRCIEGNIFKLNIYSSYLWVMLQNVSCTNCTVYTDLKWT